MFALLEHRLGCGTSPDAGGSVDEADDVSVHWDLLVEMPASGAQEAQQAAGRLPTWRLACCPLDERSGEIPAERIQDHRPLYLEYEGLISGGRGAVRRLDRGSALVERLDDNGLVAAFAGSRLRGRYEIVRAADGRLVFRQVAEREPV